MLGVVLCLYLPSVAGLIPGGRQLPAGNVKASRRNESPNAWPNAWQDSGNRIDIGLRLMIGGGGS